MARLSPEEIARLPKKAQAYIHMLESRLDATAAERDEWRDKVIADVYNAADDETNIEIGGRFGEKVNFFLPDTIAVGFHVDSVTHFRGSTMPGRTVLRASLTGGGLQIMGDSSIVIQQTASNVVQIKARDFHGI